MTNLTPMPYDYGTMVNGKWQKKGTLCITENGVLLDNEKLVNPKFSTSSRSLVFGGKHGSYARTGKLTFHISQLYFHGVMEIEDGSTVHITGFADFSATYTTIVRPVSDPNAPGTAGPILKISINSSAFNKPVNSNPINFTLITDGISTDITNRVTSHDLNTSQHTFEITMGPGTPFPPTKNLFDITMETDMSQFSGTFDFDPSQKFLWSGKADNKSIIKKLIKHAENKLETATIPVIKNTAAAAILAQLPPLDLASAAANDDDDQAAVLPGLDAQDLAFIAAMNAKGIKIATIDNISAITIGVDKDGKTKVVDKAQDISATVMNTATLKSLVEPWVSDFAIKAEPLDDIAEAIRLNNLDFFSNNANLQMGNLLKYKQDSFSGVDYDAINTISKPKLDEAWSVKSMTPERLNGYMKASTDMYGYAYAQIAEEFAAYTDSEKEQWGRAYFHWLTDPSQLDTWQKQLNVLDADQVTVWIYEWHAKLSILAPLKPYAASMEAFALAAYINAQSQAASWSDIGIPFLAEAISGGGQANVIMKTASGLDAANPIAPFIKQKLAELDKNVGAEIVAKAISNAALNWQKSNPGVSYYGYLYTTTSALDDITHQLSCDAVTAFKSWAASAPQGGNTDTQASAGEILSYCVYAAINGVILSGFAPKSSSSNANLTANFSGITIPPDIAWVLKGLKIGQIVINGSAAIFGIYFTSRIATLWEQFAVSDQPQLSEAVSILTRLADEGIEIPAFGLSFGAGLASFLKVAGPICALIGVALSAFNLATDIMNGRVGDEVLDAIGLVAGAIGAGIGIAVTFGLMTAATAGPIGLIIAVIGLIVVALKFLWDYLFPSPTPIQQYVAGPLTSLGVVNTS